MSEALLLSVIQKLDISYRENDSFSIEDYSIYNEWDTDKKEAMERVIKEMREIVDIVRDKKLEEGRSLNFLVSDLVNMADDAIDLFKQPRGSSWEYASIHSWMGEIKKQMLKLGDDETNIRSSSSENVDDEEDDNYVVGLKGDVEFLIHKRIVGGIHKRIVGGREGLNNILIKGMAGIGKTTLAREIYNHPGAEPDF